MGKFIYGEWLVPVVDYYRVLKKNEFFYEIGIPFVIAVITTTAYYCLGHTLPALLKLRDILPATLAILIGFSITCITILISTNNENIKEIKERETAGRIISGKTINIYQWILIMFTYVLLVQVFLLLTTFFTAFILRIYSGECFIAVLLFVEVYLVLHVLFLLIRNNSNFYFVFFKYKN